MPKISVIVPVYNVRDYLEKCVQSVRAQTLDDWELLLINDGSTDGSGELCRALAETDGRILVLDQPNGGVSAARNRGLDAAGGEYVTFLDGDDSYYPDHLAMLLRTAESANADVAASGMALVRADGTLYKEIRLPSGVYSGTKTILEQFFLASGQIYGACNKLIRRSLIADTRFAPFTRSEDALFCAEILTRCDVYAVSDALGYCYYRREDSATMRAPDARFVDQIRAWEKIYELLAHHAPELCAYAAGKICHDIDRMPYASSPWGKELKAVRETYYPRQFPDGALPARKKISAALYHVSPKLYYLLNRCRFGGNGGSDA